MKNQCHNCKDYFEAKTTRRKFCSGKCKTAFNRDRKAVDDIATIKKETEPVDYRVRELIQPLVDSLQDGDMKKAEEWARDFFDIPRLSIEQHIELLYEKTEEQGRDLVDYVMLFRPQHMKEADMERDALKAEQAAITTSAYGPPRDVMPKIDPYAQDFPEDNNAYGA